MRPSIADVATEIGACLAEGDEASALRLAFRCVEVYERAPLAERGRVVVQEPQSTGDPRYDAMLAAIAEYVCAREATVAPIWVEKPHRFLDQWWLVSGMKSLHADARRALLRIGMLLDREGPRAALRELDGSQRTVRWDGPDLGR